MDRRRLSDLSGSDNFSVERNIKAKNIITMVTKLIRALRSLLCHLDFFASIELLGVCVAIVDNTKSRNHVNSRTF